MLSIDHYVNNNDGSIPTEWHTDWYCPECNETCQSVNTVIDGKTWRQMPLHYCPGLFGLLAPMVKQGVHARLRVNFREDYVKSDLVVSDSRGKVAMGITTQRNDGEDLLVHSPCTVLKLFKD